MRLATIRLRGISEAFPNEISVDFDTLGPGLIAIVGENGAGKSTLIGSIFAALFRQLPGQKRSLYDFATHPNPEIDLTFSVNGGRFRSLLKLDPKARQMESYLFNGDGVPLTNGKKEPFEETIRKKVGAPEFFLSSIFSSQKRTGNFLSLDRSERKELFIRELLGLDHLRLIAATARERTEEAARAVTGLDGQCISLQEIVDAPVEDPTAVEAQLRDLSSMLERLENKRQMAQQHLLELQATVATRKPLMAEAENLRLRLARADAEIAEAGRQIAKDEKLLAEKKQFADLPERANELTARIQDLHRQIREIQVQEAANRETEQTVQELTAELKANIAELDRLRVEREELASVPCRGEGPYAGCPKIRRAVEAGQRIPNLQGNVATLSFEVEVQRSSLVQIPTPSSQVTRLLEGCERERTKVDLERRRHEELQAVEARRDERLKTLQRLSHDRLELAEELAKKESALTGFGDLDAKLNTAHRETAYINRAIISAHAERDKVIARQAQIKQRLEQRESARIRLAQVEEEVALA